MHGAAFALTAEGRASHAAATAPLTEYAAEALRAVERGTRDVVVWRCCRRDMPSDRDAFLAAAEEALGGPLERGPRAHLLLAYRMVMTVLHSLAPQLHLRLLRHHLMCAVLHSLRIACV